MICLQETGWKLDTEYTSGPWRVIASHHPKQKNSGVITMISTRLVAAENIRHAAILQGRLLHVKLEFPSHHVDILNLYQYAWNPDRAPQRMLHDRAQVWEKLGSCLLSLAGRNTLVVCGDFNCPLQSTNGSTGPGLLKPREEPADANSFSAVIETHGLVALNTWGSPRHSHTYEAHHGDTLIKTQLDYIFTRRVSADPLARKAHTRRDITLAAWRGGGRHHIVEASLPLKVYHAKPSPKPNYDQVAMQKALQDDTPSLHLFRTEVADRVTINMSPDEANQVLLQACCRYFPKTREDRMRPWQLPNTRLTLQHMWHERRQALQYGAAGDVWRAWRHIARFTRMHRHFRTQGRLNRRQLYLEHITRAQQAANRHDSRTLYSIIRQLAPKQPRRRIQLRDENHALLTNAQELQALKTFCVDLFQPQQPPALAHHTEPPCQLTIEEIYGSLIQLKAGKAVPRHLAPAVAWKGAADIMAPMLAHCFNQSAASGRYHNTWTDAWVAWLAKPHKTPDRPAHLRPIALQDAGGKSIAKALQVQAAPWVANALAALPQYAYVRGRLLETAVLRAVGHCRKVRASLAKGTTNIRSRWEGHTPTACFGGALLALDLSQAFDRVDRRKLCHSLEESGMPGPLVTAIMQWHANMFYHLDVAGHQDHVRCGRGLRQGCPLSPTLWVCVTAVILEKIQQATSRAWMETMLTFFADDILEAWEFNCEADLQWFVHCIKTTFQILEDFGMLVNAHKSSLLIALRGHTGKQWLRTRTVIHDFKPHLDISKLAGRPLKLPIVQKITYLGIILSFGKFERDSVSHRVAQADSQRFRLQKILNGKHALSLRRRLSVWRTCVSTSLLHGLSVIGIQADELRLICACFARQVRAIAACPVHLTHESTGDLFARLNVPEPHLLLQQAQDNIAQHVRYGLDPMMTTPSLQHLLQTIQADLTKAVAHWTQQATQARASEMDTGPAEPPRYSTEGGQLDQRVHGRRGEVTLQFLCPQCYLAFATLSEIKRHHRTQHSTPIPHRAGIFDRRLHALQGLPTCKHCQQEFPTWAHLSRHIMDNNCSVLWLQDQNCGTNPAPSDMVPARIAPAEDTTTVSNTGQDSPNLTRPQPEAVTTDLAPSTSCLFDADNEFAPAMTTPRTTADTTADPPAASSKTPAMHLPEPLFDPSTPLAAPAPALSIPSCQDLQLRQHIAQFGWPTVHQLHAKCTTLNSYCCICHQWMADPTQLKVHFQRIHRDLWERYNADTTQACELLRAAMTSPCIYCHRAVARPNLHASKCTVIWQACMLKHIWELPDVPEQYTLRLQGPPPQANAKARAQIQRRQQEKERQISQATGQPLKHSKPSNFFSSSRPASDTRPSAVASDDQQGRALSAGDHVDMHPSVDQRTSTEAQAHNLLRDNQWVRQACTQCPLCSHPLKDTASMRKHMRSTHASLWTQAQRLAIPASILDQAASPCKWCQASIKRPRNHVQSCQPVLLALTLAVHTGESDGNDGCGNGAAEHVQGPAPLPGRTAECTDGGGWTPVFGDTRSGPDADAGHVRTYAAGLCAGGSHRGGTETPLCHASDAAAPPDQQRCQRQRAWRSSRQEQPTVGPAVPEPELRAWSQHVIMAPESADFVRPSQTCDATRAAAHAPGSGHHHPLHVSEPTRTGGESAPASLAHQPGLEGENGLGRGGSTTEDVTTSHGTSECHPGDPHPNPGRSPKTRVSGTPNQEGLASGGPHMGIPSVGCSQAGPSPTAAAAPHVPGRPRGPFSGTAGECQLGGGAVSVPSSPPAGGGNDGSPADIPGRDRAPLPGRIAAAQQLVATSESLCPPAHRAPSACATPAAFDAGTDTPGLHEARPHLLKSLRLQNPHNLCYANSIVHSWLWTSTQLAGDQSRRFGALRQAFSQLLRSSHRALSLIDMLSWRPVFEAWTRPRDQHDAHEFFIHLQGIAAAAQFDGLWEARLKRGAQDYDITDSGHTRVGISLCLPNAPDTLDNCIKSWCLQAPYTHALTHAPDTVCLHLQRYVLTHDAQVRKNSHEIGFEAGAIVHMPVFAECTRLKWQPYRITSGVFHIGPHARAGHYRAFLAEETSPGEWHHLVTDDGIGSKVARSTIAQVIRKNCYLCMLTRMPEPRTPTGTHPSVNHNAPAGASAGASACSAAAGPSAAKTRKPKPKKKKSSNSSKLPSTPLSAPQCILMRQEPQPDLLPSSPPGPRMQHPR